MIIFYILIAIPVLILVTCFTALIIAGFHDWWYGTKYKSFILLRRDHSKPKRPAAK